MLDSLIGSWPGLALRHYPKLERLALDTQSSLLQAFINYGRKKFYNFQPWLQKTDLYPILVASKHNIPPANPSIHILTLFRKLDHSIIVHYFSISLKWSNLQKIISVNSKKLYRIGSRARAKKLFLQR